MVSIGCKFLSIESINCTATYKAQLQIPDSYSWLTNTMYKHINLVLDSAAYQIHELEYEFSSMMVEILDFITGDLFLFARRLS